MVLRHFDDVEFDGVEVELWFLDTSTRSLSFCNFLVTSGKVRSTLLLVVVDLVVVVVEAATPREILMLFEFYFNLFHIFLGLLHCLFSGR